MRLYYMGKFKMKILKKFFRDELDELLTKVEFVTNERNMQIINQLQEEISSNSIAQEKMEQSKSCNVVLFGKSKSGKSLVAAMNDSIIYIWEKGYSSSMLLFELIEKDRYHHYIHIQDVLMSEIDDGYGTLAMKALIKYAYYNKIDKIYGELSSVDNDHKDRRDYYYSKFGFSNNGYKIELDRKNIEEYYNNNI